MSSSERGQVAVRELCDALEETFNTLTQMTDKANSDDSRLAPLPSNKKYLEFTQAVLRHSLAPSKIASLVKALREMRSDVQSCLTKLETTFHHLHTLYDIMNNGLARSVSRASIISTSTNLTIRNNLSDWLKRREKTWGLLRRRNVTPVSRSIHRQMSYGPYLDFSSMNFFKAILRLEPLVCHQISLPIHSISPLMTLILHDHQCRQTLPVAAQSPTLYAGLVHFSIPIPSLTTPVFFQRGATGHTQEPPVKTSSAHPVNTR